MSLPKEGSRDVHDGIIVSMVPDICLTPAGGGMVPVPYTIWCQQADAANLANSVRQTDDRSHVFASLVLHCHGDEPGTGGGIFSGTTGAECTPKTWSQTVRAEGRNLVRHDDEWWMSHRNTYGMPIYLKDLNYYVTPEPEQINPLMTSRNGKNIPASVSADQVTQLAQASITGPAETPMGPLPGPAQVEQMQNVGSALQQGYNEQFGPGTMPLLERPAANLKRYEEQFNDMVKRLRQAAKDMVRFSDPGDCTPEQHRAMQDRVDNACTSAQRCTAADSQEVIAQKISANYLCINARRNIIKRCYKNNPDNGDPNSTHAQAIREREATIARCTSLGAYKKTPGV